MHSIITLHTGCVRFQHQPQAACGLWPPLVSPSLFSTASITTAPTTAVGMEAQWLLPGQRDLCSQPPSFKLWVVEETSSAQAPCGAQEEL